MSDGRPSVAGLVSALSVAALLGLLSSSVNAQGLREDPFRRQRLQPDTQSSIVRNGGFLSNFARAMPRATAIYT